VVVAIALVAAVLYLARPATVWELFAAADFGPLALAAAAAGAALVMRGARLVALLPPGELRIFQGTIVAAAAQAAALFAPARVGEFALPWILRRVTGRDLAAGVGTLLAARALDLAGLGLWAGWAVLAIWGWTEPLALIAAAALVVPPLMLPMTLRVVHRLAVRCLAPRGRRGRRWARRSRRLSDGVAELQRRPARLVAAAAASLVMWAFLWVLAWLLLASMGYRWPAAEVVAGSAAASLSNVLPVNVIGNLGTLEAGWTAAFAALGVPVSVAAATGLASHLWALLFAAVYGVASWIVITRSDSRQSK
jgi:glycosyltransferase 2 family protein